MCRAIAIGLPALSSGIAWRVMGDLYLYFNLISTPRLIAYQTNIPIAAAATTTTTIWIVDGKVFPSSIFEKNKIIDISNDVDIYGRGL
jgi:hypothetical protein